MTPTDTGTLVDRILDTWPDMRISETVWESTLTRLDLAPAIVAYERLRDTSTKPPTIAEFHNAYNQLRKPVGHRAGHSLSCLCAGAGWVAVTQHDDHSTWDVFTRCPDGPPSAFVEPSPEFDPVAGAAAHATFNALAAHAETRHDLADACIAAAAAYANTTRTQLL